MVNDVTVIAVEGDLDTLSAGVFEVEARKAVDGGALKIVIDGSALQFIDSAAIGKIVALLRDFRPRGGRMAIAGLRPAIRTTFEMIRLDRFIPLTATLDEAVGALR